MTEAAYQAARTLMSKANHIRGRITKAKGNVAKWTRIEDVYRREGNLTKADGTRKIILRAIDQLKSIQKEFEDLKFPDNNLKAIAKQNTCKTCGEPIGKNDSYCNDICEMADTNVSEYDHWRKRSLRQINKNG
jgi:predicted nucleic acid-binding Zn ribbon protein